MTPRGHPGLPVQGRQFEAVGRLCVLTIQWMPPGGGGETMLRRLAIWTIAFPFTFALLCLGLSAADRIWVPTGLNLPQIVSIEGDSWATSSDGVVYQYKGARPPWDYIGFGRWEEWHPPGAGRVLSVYQAPRGAGSVVHTDTGIWWDDTPLAQTPGLHEEPQQVGTTLACGASSVPEFAYVASKSEIALLDPQTGDWQVRPLSSPIRFPLFAAHCRLYYLVDGEIRFVEVTVGNIGYSIDFQHVAASVSTSASSQPGLVKALASTKIDLWALTASGDAYEVIATPEQGTKWLLLPRPPELARPRLISGIEGWMFGGSSDYVDLWLVDDDTHRSFWLSRDTNAWVPFALPANRFPSKLTSITTSSETVGPSVVRLALIDGRLFRQTPLGGSIVRVIASCLLAAVITTLLTLSFKRAVQPPNNSL